MLLKTFLQTFMNYYQKLPLTKYSHCVFGIISHRFLQSFYVIGNMINGLLFMSNFISSLSINMLLRNILTKISQYLSYISKKFSMKIFKDTLFNGLVVIYSSIMHFLKTILFQLPCISLHSLFDPL